MTKKKKWRNESLSNIKEKVDKTKTPFEDILF